jgi:beta-lactamase class A
MPCPYTRRAFLLTAAALPLAGCALPTPSAAPLRQAEDQLKELEQSAKGRLGVFAVDTGNGRDIAWRAEERFPFCSSFKMMLAAAVLERSMREPGLLDQRIRYTQADLVPHHPVTGQHLAAGMTVRELCDATMRYSDNPAANLLMAKIGGPAAVTAFARTIGDQTFRLDRIETELNTAIPGDPRDTTTPAAMTRSLQKLALGEVLNTPARELLLDWLKRNTTGDTRIRAGVPKDWIVGDKTGTGAYGTTNDIGVVWRPGAAPIVLSLYYTQADPKADARNDVLADAARIVAKAFI